MTSREYTTVSASDAALGFVAGVLLVGALLIARWGLSDDVQDAPPLGWDDSPSVVAP